MQAQSTTISISGSESMLRRLGGTDIERSCLDDITILLGSGKRPGGKVSLSRRAMLSRAEIAG